VPSTAWRFWTIVTHYPWLVQRILQGSGSPTVAGPAFEEAIRRNRPLRLAHKLLGLAPHGEDRSALSELYSFSRRRWRDVLAKQQFQTIYEGGNSLFYTGHTLFPNLSLDTRRRLAHVLGAACHVFVVSSQDSGRSCEFRGAREPEGNSRSQDAWPQQK
jgi:hypothetical protein